MATLLKAIGSSDTTLMISETPGFPAADGVIQIESEIIIYATRYMGTLYGCIRGSQSTSAASHAVGVTVAVTDFYSSISGTPGSFTTVTLTGSTASRALATDSGKVIVASATTDTELGYVSGVTSAIQTQINTKQPTLSSVTSAATLGGAASESVVVTGLLTTSTIYSVSAEVAGATATVAVTGFSNVSNGHLTLTFTADPGAGLQVRVCFK